MNEVERKYLYSMDRILIRSNEYVESLIKRKFNKEKRFSLIEDATIIGIFISLLDKAKSLNILLENQIYGGNSTLLRGIFEEGVYLEFILKEKTRDRTTAYVNSSKLKFLKIHETAKGDTPIGKAIRDMTGMDRGKLEDVYRQITDVDKLKEEYKALTGHDNPDKWYKEDNTVNSFRDVCENLGMNQLAEYEVIYRLLSQEVHGKNSNSYFKIKENELVIANREEEPLILPLMRAIVVKAGQLISAYYDDSEEYGKMISKI